MFVQCFLPIIIFCNMYSTILCSLQEVIEHNSFVVSLVCIIGMFEVQVAIKNHLGNMIHDEITFMEESYCI